MSGTIHTAPDMSSNTISNRKRRIFVAQTASLCRRSRNS